MADTFFTISTSDSGAVYSSTDIPSWLQDSLTNSFIILTINPFGIYPALATIQKSYGENVMEEITASNLTPIAIQIIKNVYFKHSNNVVQLSMDGTVLAFDNKAVFSTTKDEAKTILGSSEKISENEILIADSINNRVIIIDTVSNQIKWEYVSDRHVLDAHIILSDTLVISVNRQVQQDVTVNQNQTVIWNNDTSVPTKIYSGNVTMEDLNSPSFDPGPYGSDFESVLLQPTDRWAYKFTNIGEFGWFSYPSKTVGKILVSNVKMSSANQFIIVEGDGLESANTGRVIRVDAWGNILNYFGNGYLVKPVDARPQLNGKVTISV